MSPIKMIKFNKTKKKTQYLILFSIYLFIHIYLFSNRFTGIPLASFIDIKVRLKCARRLWNNLSEIARNVRQPKSSSKKKKTQIKKKNKQFSSEKRHNILKYTSTRQKISFNGVSYLPMNFFCSSHPLEIFPASLLFIFLSFFRFTVPYSSED